jgi:hypothetical protein
MDRSSGFFSWGRKGSVVIKPGRKVRAFGEDVVIEDTVTGSGESVAIKKPGEADPGAPPYTFRQFLSYFLRLGTFGFGGPIALAGYMQRDLVETRGWISHQDYVEGLAFAQLCPGPLAAQLAMYLGWVRAGRLGATLVALTFILPSFLMVIAIAALYVHYEGKLPWIQGFFMAWARRSLPLLPSVRTS